MFANSSRFEMAAKLLNMFLIYFQIKSFQPKILTNRNFWSVSSGNRIPFLFVGVSTTEIKNSIYSGISSITLIAGKQIIWTKPENNTDNATLDDYFRRLVMRDISKSVRNELLLGHILTTKDIVKAYDTG